MGGAEPSRPWLRLLISLSPLERPRDGVDWTRVRPLNPSGIPGLRFSRPPEVVFPRPRPLSEARRARTVPASLRWNQSKIGLLERRVIFFASGGEGGRGRLELGGELADARP